MVGTPPVQAVVCFPCLTPPITGAITTWEEVEDVGGFAGVVVGAVEVAPGGTAAGVAGVVMAGWLVPESWSWSWFSSLDPKLMDSSKKEMSWKDRGLVSS